ncbi:hypothetical protein BU17DRAFT_69462 [Hysterangium stoloniferum]|nr:hypothetical protein BU17DRAFT_69462 [Hysterangium stoloniferum]
MAGGLFIQDEKGNLVPCMVASKFWWKTPLKAVAWMFVRHKWITVVRAEAAPGLTSHPLLDYITDTTCFEDNSEDIPGMEYLYTELDPVVIRQNNPRLLLLATRLFVAMHDEMLPSGLMSYQRQLYYLCELSTVFKDYPDHLISLVNHSFGDGGFHLFYDPGNHKRLILLVPIEIGSRPYIQDDQGKFIDFPYMAEPLPAYSSYS